MSIKALKASLLRFYELGWPALAQFKVWMRLGKTSSGFDFDSDNLSSPSLHVATATNAIGETIAMCPVEHVLLLRTFAVNPKATEIEARCAGDLIDSIIERHAQQAGISKVLIVAPKDYPGLQEDDEYEQVNIYVRKVAPAIATQAVGCSTTPQAAQYLN